jgi:hypothetical protein
VSNHLEGRPTPSITRRRGTTSLAEPWAFFGDGYVVRVPRGYVTDLASIPRFLWGLIAPMDLTFAAPILHDYLYDHGGVPPPGGVYPSSKTFTRAEVDRLFARLMQEEGVVFWRRHLAWLAVRLFGRGGW